MYYTVTIASSNQAINSSPFHSKTPSDQWEPFVFLINKTVECFVLPRTQNSQTISRLAWLKFGLDTKSKLLFQEKEILSSFHEREFKISSGVLLLQKGNGWGFLDMGDWFGIEDNNVAESNFNNSLTNPNKSTYD